MKRRFFPFALALATAPALVLAQNGTPKPAQPASKAPAPRSSDAGNVTISNSPSGSAIYDDERGIARLSKDVVISQAGENFILNAQEAIYNRPKNQASAWGSLKVQTRESTLTGNRLFGDFNTKILNLTGNVLINAHGARDGIAPDRKDFRSQLNRKPVRITCNQVDWNYETRQAKIYGNIRIYQEDNVGTCERILYDEGKNIVKLMGNARFGDSKKRVFLGEDILIYLDNSRVQSNRKIRILVPREAANSNTPGATPRPTAAPAEVFAPPAEISEDDLRVFDEPRGIRTPAPTARPAAPRPTSGVKATTTATPTLENSASPEAEVSPTPTP